MKIVPLHADVTAYLRKRQLLRKWDKASKLFEANIRHPSLNTELMAPHWRGVYSFRIDKNIERCFFLFRMKKLRLSPLQITIKNSVSRHHLPL